MLRIFGFTVSLILFLNPAFAQSHENCEVVTMEPVIKDGEPTGKEVAAFQSAQGFIDSIYDDEEGYITEISGSKIKGVMCQRTDIIPTLRDFPILKTGVPLSLSTNFDSLDSTLMILYFKDNQFQYKYSGEPMGAYAQDALDDVMEVFNLQPHDL